MDGSSFPTELIQGGFVLNDPPRASKRWSRLRRQAWISRPLNRSALADSPSTVTLGEDFGSSPTRRRRRPSSLLSFSSDQTKVEHAPPLHSILSGASSISSKGSIVAKRSVKFSEENVVYDYVYDAPSGNVDKIIYELDYGYDREGFYDMFSFEETASIPSEHRWGFISRIICWLRRARARYAGETATLSNGGIPISNPLPLGAPTVAVFQSRRERAKTKRNSTQARLRKLSCVG